MSEWAGFNASATLGRAGECKCGFWGGGDVENYSCIRGGMGCGSPVPGHAVRGAVEDRRLENIVRVLGPVPVADGFSMGSRL